MLGFQGPQLTTTERRLSHKPGLVAWNRAGSKLAFCTAASPILYLYEASSLDHVGTLHPTGIFLLQYSRQAETC